MIHYIANKTINIITSKMLLAFKIESTPKSINYSKCHKIHFSEWTHKLNALS